MAGSSLSGIGAQEERGVGWTQEQLLEALAGERVLQPLSFWQRAGLLLAVLLNLALQVVYLGLVAGVFAVFVLHLHRNQVLLQAPHGGFLAVLLYVVPLGLCAALFVAMLKPFASREQEEESLLQTLEEEEEPLLFAFVRRLCAQVGAPMPGRIAVDLDVNASVSVRLAPEGFLSYTRVLRVGLPLLAGMTLRQATGILAHQFSQLSYGIWTLCLSLLDHINLWFARQVFEEDRWDLWLADAAHLPFVGLLFRLLGGFVWVVRRVLWLLMIVGHACSGFLLRSIKRNADLVELRVVGSEVFVSTLLQLRLLGLAAQTAYMDLEHAWSEKQLSDDLPVLIAAKAEQLKPEFEDVLREEAEGRAGLMDLHPSDGERIALAQALEAPARFVLDGPASALFQDFSSLSRSFTEKLYREDLQLEVGRQNLVSTRELLQRNRARAEEAAALHRYFQNILTATRLWRLPDAEEIVAEGELDATLEELRGQLLEALPAAREAYEAYDQADTLMFEAEQIERLLKAGVMLQTEEYDLTRMGLEDVAQLEERGRRQEEEAEGALAFFEAIALRRLMLALAARDQDALQEALESAGLEEGQFVDLFQAIEAMPAVYEEVFSLRMAHLCTASLLLHLDGNEDNTILLAQLGALNERQHDAMRAIRSALWQAPYPFAHADPFITLGKFLLEEVPPQEDFHETFLAAENLLDRVFTLYFRMFGKLALAAELIEDALGLPPLPQPSTSALELPSARPSSPLSLGGLDSA